MKVIFLDVDGVLNHSRTFTPDPEKWLSIDTLCLNELERILSETGAVVVLSSDWRRRPDTFSHIENALASIGFFILDVTECSWIERPRCEEIFDWIESCEESIERIAVIDDDSDACTVPRDFFFTDFQDHGLTKEIADKVIAHLNS